MTINTEDLLNSILESVGRIDYIHPVDIPNIDLYMDQVTTFMEEQLSSTKRYEDDKILTKTMINNYAKNNLLPPPNKKKYSKEHLLVLIFVYYFKNLLSIKDIEILLKPLTDKYFAVDSEFDMESIYEEVCKMEKSESCRIVFVRRMRLLSILLYVWMMKKENSFRSLPLSVISVLMCM